MSTPYDSIVKKVTAKGPVDRAKPSLAFKTDAPASMDFANYQKAKEPPKTYQSPQVMAPVVKPPSTADRQKAFEDTMGKRKEELIQIARQPEKREAAIKEIQYINETMGWGGKGAFHKATTWALDKYTKAIEGTTAEGTRPFHDPASFFQDPLSKQLFIPEQLQTRPSREETLESYRKDIPSPVRTGLELATDIAIPIPPVMQAGKLAKPIKAGVGKGRKLVGESFESMRAAPERGSYQFSSEGGLPRELAEDVVMPTMDDLTKTAAKINKSINSADATKSRKIFNRNKSQHASRSLGRQETVRESTIGGIPSERAARMGEQWEKGPVPYRATYKDLDEVDHARFKAMVMHLADDAGVMDKVRIEKIGNTAKKYDAYVGTGKPMPPAVKRDVQWVIDEFDKVVVEKSRTPSSERFKNLGEFDPNRLELHPQSPGQMIKVEVKHPDGSSTMEWVPNPNAGPQLGGMFPEKSTIGPEWPKEVFDKMAAREAEDAAKLKAWHDSIKERVEPHGFKLEGQPSTSRLGEEVWPADMPKQQGWDDMTEAQQLNAIRRMEKTRYSEQGPYGALESDLASVGEDVLSDQGKQVSRSLYVNDKLAPLAGKIIKYVGDEALDANSVIAQRALGGDIGFVRNMYMLVWRNPKETAYGFLKGKQGAIRESGIYLGDYIETISKKLRSEKGAKAGQDLKAKVEDLLGSKEVGEAFEAEYKNSPLSTIDEAIQARTPEGFGTDPLRIKYGKADKSGFGSDPETMGAGGRNTISSWWARKDPSLVISGQVQINSLNAAIWRIQKKMYRNLVPKKMRKQFRDEVLAERGGKGNITKEELERAVDYKIANHVINTTNKKGYQNLLDEAAMKQRTLSAFGGRGGLGPAAALTKFINVFFLAPRMYAGVAVAPRELLGIGWRGGWKSGAMAQPTWNPQAMRFAWENAASAAVGTVGLLELGNFLNWWEINLKDIDSADWGKAKDGSTYTDITGGKIGMVRDFYKMATAEDEDEFRDAFVYAARKRAGIGVGTGVDIYFGENVVGQEADPTKVDYWVEKGTPVGWQGIKDANEIEGGAAWMGPAELYGANVVTYQTDKEKLESFKEERAQETVGESYEELGDDKRRVIDTSPEVEAKKKELFDREPSDKITIEQSTKNRYHEEAPNIERWRSEQLKETMAKWHANDPMFYNKDGTKSEGRLRSEFAFINRSVGDMYDKRKTNPLYADI